MAARARARARETPQFTTISFIGFLEALGRIADSMSIPTDEDMKSIGAADILEYDKKLADVDAETSARLSQGRPSAGFDAPKTRALHIKLDRLIRLVLGRFGILWKGVIQFGAKRISLIGSYVSQEQVKAGG